MAKSKQDAGLFLRGRRWWLAMYVKGEKKNIPLRPEGQTHATTDIHVARILAGIARKQAKAEGLDRLREANGQGLDWTVKQFVVVNSGAGSPAQAKDNAGTVRAFLAEFTITIEGKKTETIRPATMPHQITVQRVQAWMAHLRQLGRTPATCRNHKAALSVFCEFLIDRGQLEANPCRRVKIGKIEKLLPRFLSPAEYDQALELAKQHGVYAEVATALQTGMRREELRRMAWADVDLDRGVVLVPKSKGKRPRAIPISEKLRAVLLEQRPATGHRKHVFPGQSRKDHSGMRRGSWWNDCLKPITAAMPIFHAGMAEKAVGRGFHLCRHTFASRLVQAGVPIAKVSAWLGHASITTTMIYAHLAPGHDADIDKA